MSLRYGFEKDQGTTKETINQFCFHDFLRQTSRFKALEAETKALDKDELDKISAAAGVETRPVCSLLFR